MQKTTYLKALCWSVVLCLSPTLPALGQSTKAPEEKKEIEQFIKEEAVVTKGFCNTIIQDERYYLEIPDCTLNRDVLVAITIIRGASRKERARDMRFGYGGDSMFEKMVRFVKKRDKIELLEPLTDYLGDSTNVHHQYYENRLSNVIASFPVVASSSNSSMIDITDMIMSDSYLFSLKGSAFDLKLGTAKQEQTEVLEMQAFPQNINFRSYRTYQLAEPAKNELPTSRWEVASSWFLLPEKPMRPRILDDRVGYFASAFKGLKKDDNNMTELQVANHWRLEPREEDMQRYLNGELVEPVKPIVFYIDRATPEYLVPHFIKGVNAWQSAFEKIGFKNAIYAELAPDDSLYHEGDIRYPLVSYKASPIPNAYGPMVVDPRSGEVITSHIAIYHQIQELLQRWYFVMCAAVDPGARKFPFDEEVVAELVGSVLTHEVGHTLGLRHNFIGSTVYPTDSLRSADFIRKNGLGSSIMDYQRYNYVAQPGDKLERQDLIMRIGIYDDFAIEWAYRYFPSEMDSEMIGEHLEKWVTDKRKDPRLFFLYETEIGDPRSLAEDYGDDIVKSNTYGIENLKFIMKNLKKWNNADDTDYFVFRKKYLSVIQQYWNYIGHVIQVVGGHYADRPNRDEDMIVYKPVPKEKQQAALAFLSEYCFNDQEWLYPYDVMEKTNTSRTIYEETEITSIVNKLVLKYSMLQVDSQGYSDVLSVDELFDYIYTQFFKQNEMNGALSIRQRTLQRLMIQALVLNGENQSNLYNGIGLKLKNMVMQIKSDMGKAAETNSDSLTAMHYRTIYNFISLWEGGKNNSLSKN